MNGEPRFDCPVFEGQVSDYDCSEISTGIHLRRFIDDGIPFLMDIRAALARKHRCHACHRCPNHYKPREPHLAQMMQHLGFPDSAEGIETALTKVQEQYTASLYQIHEGCIRFFQLPSGIQIWQEWDAHLNVAHDTQVHFVTSNAMYLKPQQIIRYCQPGHLVRSSLIAEAVNQIASDNSLVSNGFTSPNLSIFREKYIQQDAFVAQIAAFPAKLTLFENVEDYLEKREKELAAESFVSGLAMSNTVDHTPGADALLTGSIEKVHMHENEVTGLPFYHLEVRCLGLLFDVVVSAEQLTCKPKAGHIMQGVCWLSARMLNYGFTGYEIEFNVTTPLTAKQFEPIALIMDNLQPGERLYCGIDPPIGEMVYVRAKGEVEGISVEFRLDPQDVDEPEPESEGTAAVEDAFRIYRFYPVSKAMAIDMFEKTLILNSPPSLADALNVTEEYLTN